MLSKHTDNSDIPESGDEAVDKCGVLAAILNWRKEELDATERVFLQVAKLQTTCKMLQRGKWSSQTIDMQVNVLRNMEFVSYMYE